MHCDIIVIGGGTSTGFLLAFLAERAGGKRPDILVLDKNREPFRKIHASGNGRCNFSNSSLSETSYYSVAGSRQWQAAAYEAATRLDLRRYLFENGMPSRCDEYGRLMPFTNSAKTIGRFLDAYLRNPDITFCNEAEATALSKDAAGFAVTYRRSRTVFTVHAKTVVFACGGCAYPQAGTDGSAFALLRGLGHTITRECAGIVPLETSDSAFHGLAGLKLECRITTAGFARTGEILFTEYGISGPNILYASNAVSLALSAGPMPVVLDVLPEEHLTLEYFRSLHARAREKTVSGIFGGVLREEFITAFLRHSGLPERVPDHALERVYRALKEITLTVARTRPFKEAQVSLGGVAVDELDPAAFESRRHANLFIMGEAIDYTGGCGGYNIHWCAATARGVAARLGTVL